MVVSQQRHMPVNDANMPESLPLPTRSADHQDIPKATVPSHSKRQDSQKHERASSDTISTLVKQIEEMTSEEALKILRDTIKRHADDPNFPTQERETLCQLLDGQKDYEGDNQLKLEAVTIKYFSPYLEVRAVTDPVDREMPCETIRAYVLGLLWSVIGQFCNTYFSTRASVTVDPAMCQMLLAPMGKFAAWIIPDWGFTIRGTRHSLNPGPWSYKEQTLATILLDISLISAYALRSITLQEGSTYYDEQWLTPAYKLLLILSSQFLGLGLAGLLRQFVIIPVQALWPSTFPVLALNRALILPERKCGKGRVKRTVDTLTEITSEKEKTPSPDPESSPEPTVPNLTPEDILELSALLKDSRNTTNWKISKLRFSLYTLLGTAVWYWFPGYIFQALSQFSWMTWIKPNNIVLAMVTGTQNGLGFNPLPTFDWNLINSNSPLSTPFFSCAQQWVGMLLSGIAILIVYFTNHRWSAYLPINNNQVYSNTGDTFDGSQVLDSQGRFSESKYHRYSPVYLSAGDLVLQGAYLFTYLLVLFYMLLEQGKTVVGTYANVWTHFKRLWLNTYIHTRDFIVGFAHGKLKEARENNAFICNKISDPFVRSMRTYSEVPSSWFFLVAFASFVVALIILKVYKQLHTPVWVLIFCIGINLTFLIPINVLYAMTGNTVGLGILVRFVVGCALPGNANAVILANLFGDGIDIQASGYAVDQKIGHYAYIPPRAVFRSQIVATVVTSFVSFGFILLFKRDTFNECDSSTGSYGGLYNGGSVSYFSEAIEWGTVGTRRVILEQYPELVWLFLAGFLVAVFLWAVRRYGHIVRTNVKSRTPTWFYTTLNWTLFRPLSSLHSLEPTFLSLGLLNWASNNLAYYTVGFHLSCVFMYGLRKYKTGWWQRYNYVLAAALNAGVTLTSVFIFILREKNIQIDWWGNRVVSHGDDGSTFSGGYKPIPKKGYFGLDSWS